MVYCEYIFDIQNIDTGIGIIKYFFFESNWIEKGIFQLKIIEMLFGKIDFWFLTDIAYMEIDWTEEEINLFSE